MLSYELIKQQIYLFIIILFLGKERGIRWFRKITDPLAPLRNTNKFHTYTDKNVFISVSQKLEL